MSLSWHLIHDASPSKRMGRISCEVKIVEDSVNGINRVRLTTMQLKYWRSLHAEL